jgi:hypothetical protein
MQTSPPSDEPELSPSQRYGLLIVAIVAALLGVTTLDVSVSQAAKKQRNADAERTAECIVASAVFVGVAPVQAP